MTEMFTKVKVGLRQIMKEADAILPRIIRPEDVAANLDEDNMTTDPGIKCVELWLAEKNETEVGCMSCDNRYVLECEDEDGETPGAFLVCEVYYKNDQRPEGYPTHFVLPVCDACAAKDDMEIYLMAAKMFSEIGRGKTEVVEDAPDPGDTVPPSNLTDKDGGFT